MQPLSAPHAVMCAGVVIFLIGDSWSKAGLRPESTASMCSPEICCKFVYMKFYAKLGIHVSVTAECLTTAGLPQQALQPRAGIPPELVTFGSVWDADASLGAPPLRQRLPAGREAAAMGPVKRSMCERPGAWGPVRPRLPPPGARGVEYAEVEFRPRCDPAPCPPASCSRDPLLLSTGQHRYAPQVTCPRLFL